MGGFWDRVMEFLRVRELPGTPDTSSGLARVSVLAEALASGGQVPGIALRAQCRGQLVLEAAFGYASIEEGRPAIPETVFRIASVSKPITATALARLVDNGVLALDDPLECYVPEYPHRGISMRQLASHTAGVRGYRGIEFARNEPISIEQGLEIFRDDPLLFKPGTDYHYNSYDYVLLSLAMERAAGISFERLVRETVLDPIGLDYTVAETPGVPVAGQAEFYSRHRTGFRRAAPVDNRFKLAGGGYLSTTADICKLGQAWLEGKVAKETVAREFISSQLIDGTPTWYGLGWQVSRDGQGRPYFGHVGNGVGGYSNFFIYPEQELVICMLINSTDPKVQPVLDAIVEAIHGESLTI